jgi:hypothetical protein
MGFRPMTTSDFMDRSLKNPASVRFIRLDPSICHALHN